MIRPLPILAQLEPDDATAAPKAPPPPKENFSFGGFQKGFKQFNDGKSDNTLGNGLLAIVGVLVLVAIIINIRQRIKNKKTPDSEKKLFVELAKVVHIPFMTRVILRWVAKTSKVDAAVLLVSQPAFDSCITKWEEDPTFAPLRKWGKKRLDKLRPVLFD